MYTLKYTRIIIVDIVTGTDPFLQSINFLNVTRSNDIFLESTIELTQLLIVLSLTYYSDNVIESSEKKKKNRKNSFKIVIVTY